MTRLIIRRSGPLHGTVAVSGAKNAALPILSAALLTDAPCEIEGVPRVSDVHVMLSILRWLGRDVQWEGDRLTIRAGREMGWTAPYELVNLMRASICVLGPLLARHGRARVSMPGGCVIGPRPVDLHLKGLQALGARIATEHGDIVAQASRLRGAAVHLAGPAGSSVLATANTMMAAALAEGATVIEHAACEPEVVDLAECLIGMGAHISGHGTASIRVEGVERLGGMAHRIIPDRIETGTLMLAVGTVGGDVTLRGARAEHLQALSERLAEAGVSVAPTSDGLRVRRTGRPRGVTVTTLPYPGFPTDLQAPMMAMMAVGDGVSVVHETIYPERFMHVPELRRMGAAISRDGASAIVHGVEALDGAPVNACDLRAAAALVLAGMAANNTTELHGVEHLDRGYDGLERKLAQLGASIHRVDSKEKVKSQNAKVKTTSQNSKL